ncbi:MAG TPA: hypothetical protein VLV18_07535 [Terriglobales bacterium]|nr:hypothetical protein [Terriglobales bacterium]
MSFGSFTKTANSKSRKWLIILLIIHLIVPSPQRSEFYPFWAFIWFGFDWAPDGGWFSFIQYSFAGLPAFILIGLATIIPFTLLVLILIEDKVRSVGHALGCLLLSLVLSAVYFYGWFDYTWPALYQPVQTVSIVLVTLLACKNWIAIKDSTRRISIRPTLKTE